MKILRGLSGWLIRKTMAPDSECRSTAVKIRLGMLQGWASIVINLFIFVLKLSIGLILGSIALIADSIDSLFDVIGSAVVIGGFIWIRKPHDREHPFGHGRVDLVAGLILAVLLIVVGFELGRASMARIMHPAAYLAPWSAILVVALTIPMKQWLTVFCRHITRATGSYALESDYWFHYFDAITSSVVCVGLILSRFGWAVVDGWIGLFIALVIAWTGFQLVMKAIGPLLGEAPDPDEVDVVEKTAKEVPGVNGVHSLIIHKYGDVKLVSFHIEVDAQRSAMQVHDTAEKVERAVEMAAGCKAIVHVDPIDLDHPMYKQAKEALAELLVQNRRLVAFHDLRISGGVKRHGLSVDVVVGVDVREGEYEEISRQVQEYLNAKLEGMGRIQVNIERSYLEEKG